MNTQLQNACSHEKLIEMGLHVQHNKNTGYLEYTLSTPKFHLLIDAWYEVKLARLNPQSKFITLHVTNQVELQAVIDWVKADDPAANNYSSSSVGPEYEYELFFKSEPHDSTKIDGWYPIATDRIKHPHLIEKYIESGLLRRINTVNDQVPPESNPQPNTCDLYDDMNHCDSFRFKKHETCKSCRYKKNTIK